ncbi:glycoside hydrolase family 10 protein [Roseateles chitinivorans]|uniref:glycoside hydrolase family 10 protein n=1 Tax=Roseateles chitinivorans TaxID=2917965 RepID=UPI003D67641B
MDDRGPGRTGTRLRGDDALGLRHRPATGPARDTGRHAGRRPPPAPREFRAAWVATVANIDWPSRRGLSDAAQVAEIHAILDSARALRLNAIVLQVRTSADAFYRSTLEPWSEYLSGVQGQGPGYDPLALWIEQAHARGLELHAWLNPYRAKQSGGKSASAATHLSRTRPEWVKKYGDQLWIDPGEPAAAEHTLAVCRDLLTRYAVDGLHIDDYFYPYPVQDAAKQDIDFPDEPSWQRYLLGGGTLPRADWRRDNVDQLVRRLYELVRDVRPTARVGISPFGLPRPDLRPAGITGFSQYDKLYAHVEHWMAMGWLDYVAPQLYWPRAQKPQAFEPLMRAWQGVNPLGRHVWPGLFTSRAANEAEGWPLDEIPAQVDLMRTAPATGGHLHFSMVALLKNRRDIAATLRDGAYAQAALTPTFPWLSAPACAAPSVSREPDGSWRATVAGTPACRFAPWRRPPGSGWRFEVLPPDGRIHRPGPGETLVLSAINAIGDEGPRATFVA